MRVAVTVLLVVVGLASLVQGGFLNDIRNKIEGGVGKLENGVMNQLSQGLKADVNTLQNNLKKGMDKLLEKGDGKGSDSLFGHITGDDRVHLLNDVKTADIYLNVPQLLTKNGYPAESYVVKTDDDYLITLHRIPHGRNKPAQPSKDVIVLFRALFSGSYQFLFLGPEKALGYRLADLGYDVWMVEMRGNSYSRAHATLQPNNEKYWNMSWHEMGVYDVPTSINFVLNKTGVDQVFVLGHSMGNTVLFVGLSQHPWLNEKIRLMIAMGPTTSMAHMGGPLGPVIRAIPEPAWDLLPYTSMFPLTLIDVIKFLGKTLCGTAPTAIFCTLIFSAVDGNDFGRINSTEYPAMLAHIPESDSTKNVMHYFQGVTSGKFQQFDYGEPGNMRIYGRSRPEEYDLSRVTAPVALFTSEGDMFATVQDSKTLASKLPDVVLFNVTTDKGFTHIDFVFANNADVQVYELLYRTMEEY